MVVWINAASSPLAAQTQQAPPSDRLGSLEAWVSAVEQHQAGVFDEAARRVNRLTQEQLRWIIIDLNSLVSLIREPTVQTFFYAESLPRSDAPRIQRGRQILYSAGEMRRLRALANTISPKREAGPENDLLKRGAMLHADIEMLTRPESRQRGDAGRPGPAGVTLYMADGQQVALQGTISHFSIGRGLLDRVRPTDAPTLKPVPYPKGDDTVRLWYLATCTFMQAVQNIYYDHFARALDLFPDDPDLLFTAGAVHEWFAGPRAQAVNRTMKVPRDVGLRAESEGTELREAQQLYERALRRRPDMTEASLRLGRVLARRGRHEEAAARLRLALSATQDPVIEYYAALFLAAEAETLGNTDEARRSYQRAAMLFPQAQSPLLGLSRLLEQSGDRAGARTLVQKVVKLPPELNERVDPWWVYEIVTARDVDRVLADLRRRF
jgi:hypothetical protein